VLPMNQTVSIC